MAQNINKIYWRICLSSIFLIAVGFMGLGDTFVLLLLGINCILQFRLNKKVNIDIELIVLVTSMLFYSIGGKIGFIWTVKCTLLPALFYILGTLIPASADQSICEYRAKAIVIILSLGLLAESILNALPWRPDYGRCWPEFWSGRTLPATQHVFFNLLITGLIFYGIYRWKNRRLLNSFLVLGGVWCLWFSLITGSRLVVMVFLLVTAANIILFFYLNRHQKTFCRCLRIFMICLFIMAIVSFILYTLNIGGIYDYMHSYMWTRNGGILHNIRFQAQFSVIKQLFKYPFGGSQMDLAGLNFAHNVWLDTANRSGFLPFVLLAAYAIITFYDLIKFIRIPTIGHDIKYLLFSAYLSLFLFYMVEAALEANIMFWAPWALICGLIKGILRYRKTI